jgi:hypothetical protein
VLGYAESNIDNGSAVILQFIPTQEAVAGRMYEERDANMEKAAALILANPNFAKTVLTKYTIDRFRGRPADPDLLSFREARSILYSSADEYVGRMARTEKAEQAPAAQPQKPKAHHGILGLRLF